MLMRRMYHKHARARQIIDFLANHFHNTNVTGTDCSEAALQNVKPATPPLTKGRNKGNKAMDRGPVAIALTGCFKAAVAIDTKLSIHSHNEKITSILYTPQQAAKTHFANYAVRARTKAAQHTSAHHRSSRNRCLRLETGCKETN